MLQILFWDTTAGKPVSSIKQLHHGVCAVVNL